MLNLMQKAPVISALGQPILLDKQIGLIVGQTKAGKTTSILAMICNLVEGVEVDIDQPGPPISWLIFSLDSGGDPASEFRRTCDMLGENIVQDVNVSMSDDCGQDLTVSVVVTSSAVWVDLGTCDEPLEAMLFAIRHIHAPLAELGIVVGGIVIDATSSLTDVQICDPVSVRRFFSRLNRARVAAGNPATLCLHHEPKSLEYVDAWAVPPPHARAVGSYAWPASVDSVVAVTLLSETRRLIEVDAGRGGITPGAIVLDSNRQSPMEPWSIRARDVAEEIRVLLTNSKAARTATEISKELSLATSVVYCAGKILEGRGVVHAVKKDKIKAWRAC